MANSTNTVADAVNTAASTVGAKIATGAQYGGGSVAFLGGLTANEFAALGGLLIGVVGLAMNWWYKHQHLQIALKKAQPDPEE